MAVILLSAKALVSRLLVQVGNPTFLNLGRAVIYYWLVTPLGT